MKQLKLNTEDVNFKQLLKQISDKSVPTQTIAKIRDSYYNHLNSEYGTPDNYSDYPKEIIDALNQYFPYAINKHKCQSFTNKKIRNIFKTIGPLIEQNQRVNVSSQILQMYLNYLKPETTQSVNQTQKVELFISGDNFTKPVTKS